MHDPGVEQEKQLQFEKDEAAFNALSPRAQRIAEIVATGGYYGRAVLKAAGTVLAVAVDVLLKLPYVAAAYVATSIMNGVVTSLEWGVKAIASARLALDRHRHDQEWRDKITAWKDRTIKKIDQAWKTIKEKAGNAAKKTFAFMEYYGALGLYRATEWILNPRRPSGKPLFGNERVNKTVGIILAAAAFTFLAFELTHLAVMAKIWHLQLAQSMLTDTAPLYIQLLKQAVFHPLLTFGLTAVKFLTLPMIAATRNTIKSTEFTQAVAYKYNQRLRQPVSGKTKRWWPFAKLPALSFATKFAEHIIEKASPEFYKARLRHYQELTIPADAAAGQSRVGELALAGTFNEAESTAVKKAAIAAAPIHNLKPT